MGVRIPLIAANWKMHKTTAEARAFVSRFLPAVQGLRECDVVLAPPHTALAAVGDALRGGPVQLAAQNVHPEPQGASTGEVSVELVRELGCRYAPVGHSARRALFGEDDALVQRKLRAVVAAGLAPILCVGESLAQRQAGETEAVLARQLKAGLEGITPEQAAVLVVAYEPIWAIGTGQTATPDDAQAGCAFARGVVEELFGAKAAGALRVQYGGSVKAELLAQPDVDGALVGGASLDPASFAGIVRAAVSP